MKDLFLILLFSFYISFSYAQFTLQDSLVAHYPMSGDMLDASGFANHGSVNGPVLTTDRFGTPNEAYFFDGVDDEVVLMANSSNFKPPLPVTIAAWVEIYDYQNNNILRNDYTDGVYSGPWMHLVNGKLNANYGDGGPIGPNWRRSKVGTSTIDLNRWYHLAVVIRGAQDMDLYIDGVLDCGTYNGTGSAMAYSMANGILGVGSSTNNLFFHGKMDDVRLYSRGLSIDEIRALADFSDLETLNICSGDSTSLDADDGSATYQWSPIQGLSCTSCPAPIANPTDTTLYQVIRDNGFACLDTFFFQVNPENCNAGVCNPGFTLQDSLVAHYPMSGDMLDASGFANHGSVNGPVLTTDRFGTPNEAYFFDGVDDEVVLMANSSNFKPSLPVTIAAWVEIYDYQNNNILRNDYTDGVYSGPWMHLVNGKLNANYGNGGPIGPSWRRSKVGTSTIDLNRWYHLAVVIRGAQDMELYIDGVQDCGTYNGTGSAMAYSMANGILGVGSSTNNLFFHGKWMMFGYIAGDYVRMKSGN